MSEKPDLIINGRGYKFRRDLRAWVEAADRECRLRQAFGQPLLYGLGYKTGYSPN